jgi:hypothetical protein
LARLSRAEAGGAPLMKLLLPSAAVDNTMGEHLRSKEYQRNGGDKNCPDYSPIPNHIQLMF